MAFTWIGKSSDGKSVTLNQLNSNQFRFPKYFNSDWETSHADTIRIGAAIDVETTGLSHSNDKVIEIGVRQFKFNRLTGEILTLGASYSSFQDPEQPLSDEIKLLTGITDEMLNGQKINWNEVNHLLNDAQIIIAHNAAFDRPFVDQATEASGEKIWACTLKQIDWMKRGFSSPKLELLSIYHGFFTESHRALNDADALIYLMSFQPESSYFLELITNAKKQMIHMIASGAPFESKDHLKGRSYRWDNKNKYWNKTIFKDHLPSEIEWLESIVYNGKFRGNYNELQLTDTFKAQTES